MSSSNCCFLTCIQISQEAGQAVWYSYLSKNFPQFVVIHTVKGFGTVNKAEIDVFLELSYIFDDPTDVGNLISGSSAFSKSSLHIWKFTVHILLRLVLENFEHYFASMWDECNCVVVWAFFGIAFLWDWNENWPFPVLWPLLSFPDLLAYWVQHFHSNIRVIHHQHYAEYIMRNARLDESQAGIKIAGRNLRHADDITLTAESKEELKSLLMKSARGEWKSWLKTQHSKKEDHAI